MRVTHADDCCLSVCLPPGTEPVLVIDADDADRDPQLDAFVPGALNWPVVYWSNGTITGGIDPTDEALVPADDPRCRDLTLHNALRPEEPARR